MHSEKTLKPDTNISYDQNFDYTLQVYRLLRALLTGSGDGEDQKTLVWTHHNLCHHSVVIFHKEIIRNKK